MQIINKFILLKNFRGSSSLIVQLWWMTDFFFFKLFSSIMYGGRRFFLRPNVIITYSWIGDNVELYSLGEIEIGSNVVISQKSYLCSVSHDYDKENFPIWSGKIVIEDECWLATDVYVAPNVTIGKGTVVGARSSVFKNLPSGKICIGSPAVVIKERINEKE